MKVAKFCKEEFLVKEYELARYCSIGGKEEFTETEKNIFGKFNDEILANKEYLKYAVSATKDVFGKTYLNGIITPFTIIANLQNVDSEIAEILFNNLFNEYYDEEQTKPIAACQNSILGISYLEAILLNNDIIIDEKYHKKIAECMNMFRETSIFTAFFLRKEIPIDCKKKIIDFLDEDILYLLPKKWEEIFFNSLMDDFYDGLYDDDVSEEELLEEEKVRMESEAERHNLLDEVIELINEKLYS